MYNFEQYIINDLPESLLEKVQDFSPEDIHAILAKDGTLTIMEAACLVSPAAAHELEALAVRAQKETLQKFGRTILLYIPLYLSNICINGCRYCGFSSQKNGSTLTMDEIIKEADILYNKGFRHILIVAGDNPAPEFTEKLLQTVEYLRPRFSSIALEIAPGTFDDYSALVDAGADSLTLYQETYHRPTYKYMHPRGPKSSYSGRLEAIEHAARAGIRRINLGALMGLYDWRYEFLALYLHYRYLIKKYWDISYSISFPRLRKTAKNFTTPFPVSDKELVQMILAARIAMPEVGLVLSTRESPWLRDHLIGLGITQMSAGSSTQPGGYTRQDPDRQKQFEIADNRPVEEVIQMIKNKGYDPVWKDWEEICHG